MGVGVLVVATFTWFLEDFTLSHIFQVDSGLNFQNPVDNFLYVIITIQNICNQTNY